MVIRDGEPVVSDAAPWFSNDYVVHPLCYNLHHAGFMVIRDGELVFMSPQQQHEFNFPYQIGSPDSMSDTPQV